MPCSGEMNFPDGEIFTSPEAIMTYSKHGFGEMSRNMHKFIREHIYPPEVFPCRPVVINTWEASFFDIVSNKVLTTDGKKGIIN